ncbi:hypothetical protein DCAR_0206135 [Daucus carota subsp. sativus]|uniref:Uncharacterized protein n=1 Tax=Daucus carota subsp. sativus TaxID=79200 RepID=A0A162AR13_DAUCS|nr:hypothetical protein DCAR_0206135 [Daucus carota subsp. sativus]
MEGWGSAFRWVEVSMSLPTSLFRWPRLLLSGFLPSWRPEDIHRFMPTLDFSIIDTLLWSVISALESVAIVFMLCFFYIFCGCTI